MQIELLLKKSQNIPYKFKSSWIIIMFLATISLLSLMLSMSDAYLSYLPARFHTSLQAHTNQQPSSPAHLGKSSIIKATPLVIAAATSLLGVSKALARDSYLVEPTAEFKEEQQKTADLIKAQTKVRKEWDTIVKKLEESEEPKDIEANLNALISFLSPIDGIPTGVKKTDIVKICRKKKFNGRKIKPNWTTDVEIAYQKFILDFNRKMTPVNSPDSKF